MSQVSWIAVDTLALWLLLIGSTVLAVLMILSAILWQVVRLEAAYDRLERRLARAEASRQVVGPPAPSAVAERGFPRAADPASPCFEEPGHPPVLGLELRTP